MGNVRDYSRSIDYRGFLNKYRSHVDSHYIWGYFSHLIADDIWLKGFYLPWLKNRMEANDKIMNLYHNDFQLLNGKLLEHYGLTVEIRNSLGNLKGIIDLQEVKSRDVEEFLPYVLGDMEYDEHVIHDKLHVFTFDQILGYVETSIDKGLLNLKNILSTSSLKNV